MTKQEKLQQVLEKCNLKEITPEHLEQLKYIKKYFNCANIACDNCIFNESNNIERKYCSIKIDLKYYHGFYSIENKEKDVIDLINEIIDAVEQCNSQKYNDNIDLITLEVSEEFNNCVMINIKYNGDKVESLVLEDGFEFDFNKNYPFETGIFKCLLEDIKSTIDKTNKELFKQNLTPEEYYYSQIPEVEFVKGVENYFVFFHGECKKFMVSFSHENKIFGLKYISNEGAKRFCEIYNNKGDVK